jgi:hypothetical protein
MSDVSATLVSRAREWFERAHAEGWLSDGDLRRFESLERRTPAELFAEDGARPLVVAFFGGTGVGKSSLLNRLAGEPIARTGVERPTSREVTIYLHESVALAELPPELPVEHVRVQRHQADDRRGIMWIDAPDIDSTHEANRQLALAWLPHVDLLVYVVSPERYRDDVGWRVLRQRGHKHGWMFVMNRWDEGDASQKEDFARMLREAGSSDPLLLCTCCAAANESEELGELFAETGILLPTPDEFDQIEETINTLLAEHGVRELERLGHRARLLEMRDTLSAARRRVGDAQQWKEVSDSCERHWSRARTAILEGLEWPIRAAAGRFAIRERGLLGQMVRQAVAAARGAGPRAPRTNDEDNRAADAASSDAIDPVAAELTRSLWDDWAQDKLAESLDAVEVEVRRTGVAAAPLRGRLDEAAGDAGRIVSQHVQQELRTALARPGTTLQRVLRRMTGFSMAAFPLFALLWVAYNVVTGYERASTEEAAYLGSDFAVHSVMLVVIAWAVPFVCDRLLRPSLERVTLRAMRQGLIEGLDQIGARLHGGVADVAGVARACQEDAAGLVGEISSLALKPLATTTGSLSRLLVSPARGPARAEC